MSQIQWIHEDYWKFYITFRALEESNKYHQIVFINCFLFLIG